MATERSRVLHRTVNPNPVEGLLDEAAPTAVPEPTRPQIVPPPAPEPAPTSERNKKQVNYRLDPGMINELKRASIVYSFRMGQQHSQNSIVEQAVREWLERNGPWD